MLNSIRVKICGITRPEDARTAAKNGADAIGLVFYDKSPRNVTIEQAQKIIEALPPFVSVVGLFVDAEVISVEKVLRNVSLDILQFHGAETADYCNLFARPYIKAIRMRPDVDLHACAKDYSQARSLLLDTYVQGTKGGTGQPFDWQRIPTDLPKPVVLAGGLTPDNIQDALNIAHPVAVDISGGVEQAKGIKDPVKIHDFMTAIQHFNTHNTDSIV